VNLHRDSKNPCKLYKEEAKDETQKAIKSFCSSSELLQANNFKIELTKLNFFKLNFVLQIKEIVKSFFGYFFIKLSTRNRADASSSKLNPSHKNPCQFMTRKFQFKTICSSAGL